MSPIVAFAYGFMRQEKADTFPILIATFRVARLTLQTRKLWLVSRPTVTRVTFDLPECKQLFLKKKKKRKRKQKQNKKNEKKCK